MGASPGKPVRHTRRSRGCEKRRGPRQKSRSSQSVWTSTGDYQSYRPNNTKACRALFVAEPSSKFEPYPAVDGVTRRTDCFDSYVVADQRPRTRLPSENHRFRFTVADSRGRVRLARPDMHSKSVPAAETGQRTVLSFMQGRLSLASAESRRQQAQTGEEGQRVHQPTATMHADRH